MHERHPVAWSGASLNQPQPDSLLQSSPEKTALSTQTCIAATVFRQQITPSWAHLKTSWVVQLYEPHERASE